MSRTSFPFLALAMTVCCSMAMASEKTANLDPSLSLREVSLGATYRLSTTNRFALGFGPRFFTRSEIQYQPISSLSNMNTATRQSVAVGVSIFDLFSWEIAPDMPWIQYAKVRTDGDIYFLGRAGYEIDENVEYYDVSIDEIIDNFNIRGAVGLGAGYKFSNGERFEVEYTTKKQDFSVLSFGLTF